MKGQSDNLPADPGHNSSASVDGEPAITVLGDFALRREIGRGGMGTVYEAGQQSLRRTVAVKVLARHVSASEAAVTRFQREAQAAAKLHHAHIVPIFALGEESGIYYYAMELIDGPGLNSIISTLRQNQLPKEPGEELAETLLLSRAAPSADADAAAAEDSEVIALDAIEIAPTLPTWQIASFDDPSSEAHFRKVATHMAQVADALDYAHKQGVIHRDIKPHNLLLTSGGKLMVSDFGLARLSEQPGVTVTGEVLGSPLYMSPEQIGTTDVPVDHRTDIYALGATMYEWLTLSPPYPGETRERVISKILTSETPSLISRNSAIPIDLETICLKALEHDPKRRYQTAGEFRDDLRRFLEDRPIRARRLGASHRALRFIGRHQLASLATAAAVVALTLSWALFSKGRDLQTQTAAVEQVQEDRERLLDDILSLMPAEIGGTVRLAEAAVPVLQGVVNSPAADGSFAGGSTSGGADPSAAGTTRGIVQRFSRDLYGSFVTQDWPARPVDANDELAQLALQAIELAATEPLEAVSHLGEYLQRDPRSFEAWQLHAALLGQTGQGELMHKAIDSMAQLHPDDAFVDVWRAAAYLLEDNAVRSLQDLTRNHQNADVVPWMLTLRSLALARVGAALEAFLALNEAIDRDPDLVVALLARASIQATAGNASGAIEDLSRVLEIEPNNADVIGLRGDRYVETGNFEAAANDYDRAMAIAGRSPNMVLRYLYARTQGRETTKGSSPSAMGTPTVKTSTATTTTKSSGGFFENLVRRFL